MVGHPFKKAPLSKVGGFAYGKTGGILYGLSAGFLAGQGYNPSVFCLRQKSSFLCTREPDPPGSW